MPLPQNFLHDHACREVCNCIRYCPTEKKGRKPEIKSDSGTFIGLRTRLILTYHLPLLHPSSYPTAQEVLQLPNKIAMNATSSMFHCANSGTSSYLVRILPGVVFTVGCDTHRLFSVLSAILTFLYNTYLLFSSKKTFYFKLWNFLYNKFKVFFPAPDYF